jgi:arabinogalactan oligomer/maltooligosaccharide transport system substrate-binding protein
MVSENKEILINSPGSIKALEYLIDLRIKDKILPQVVDFANDYDNQQTGFKQVNMQ